MDRRTGAVPTTGQKLKFFLNASFVDKVNTFLWHIYEKEDIFACMDRSLSMITPCYCDSLKQES